jgi:hypothetical protein
MMKDRTSNPFNITKAVDFSNQEINDYWVDIPSGEGFVAMAKPTSPMPMLILGGKGSGKTHLMRYFSYPLQRIRHAQDVTVGIQNDKYVGIYLRCGGLNAERFKNKGQTEEIWADIFAYYMELWLSQLALETVLSALGGTEELARNEPAIAAELGHLIDVDSSMARMTLSDLGALLRRLQQDLDRAINNSVVIRSLPVHIAINRGDLVFGIPRIIASRLDSFRDFLFVYLLDEFENLSDTQQKYVNTLLRERQSPCSFKIGARLFGVRTLSTYSADEENKEGSEFEVLRLDNLLRENSKYGRFARRLLIKRLEETDRNQTAAVRAEKLTQSIDECFEEPERSEFSKSETDFLLEKYRDRERPYFKELRQYLELGIKSNSAPGLLGSGDVEKVLILLKCPEFPLLEKANIFFFYQDWRSQRDLLEAARTIADDCAGFRVAKDGPSRYVVGLSHFRADLLAQLYRDTHHRQRYLGLSTFIEMSSGLPRNLLVLLKHIYAWATFNGERPFRDIPISMRSQQAGVLEASEWFYKDAQMIGSDGPFVMNSIDRLGTLFRGIRFSNKPAECSCSTFSADLSRASARARQILKLAENWSLVIDVGRQRDRNTKRMDAKFQLNPMLAPRWDLSIYRRGAVALAPDEVNAVFDPEYALKFEDLARKRIARMTPPFFVS